MGRVGRLFRGELGHVDKQRLIEALEKITRMAPGELCGLSVEDVGILLAFLSGRESQANLTATERRLHDRIRKAIERWRSCPPTPPGVPGRENRSQYALRLAIDKVLDENFDSLTANETALLRATHAGVTQRKKKDEQNKRLAHILTKVVAALDARGATVQHAPLFSTFEEAATEVTRQSGRTNHVDPDAAFRDKVHSPVSLLDGIVTQLNARVFEYKGDTVVDGNLPNDVLLRVVGGGLTVHGLATGHAIVDGDIRVDGNVQGGTLISRNGAIQVDRVLLGASLIAKSGDINCNYAESPRTLFAWDALTIDGALVGGRTYAATVNVKEEISGAEVHSCGAVQAGAVRTAAMPSVVVLRRQLTCDDYGRPTDEDTHNRRRRLTQLELEISSATNIYRFTRMLIQGCYRTALFYLLGGASNAQKLLELQGLQAKSLHLRQLLVLIEGVAPHFEALVDPERTGRDEDTEEVQAETLQALKYLKEEIQLFPDEYGAVHRRYLLDRCKQCESLLVQLSDARDQHGADWRERLEHAQGRWHGVLRDCERDIEVLQQATLLDPALMQQLDTQPEGLQEYLKTQRDHFLSQGTQDELKRAQSPLLRLLEQAAGRYERNVEAAVSRVKLYQIEAASLRAALAEDAAVRFGAGDNTCYVKSGWFDEGTVITASDDRRKGIDAAVAESIAVSASSTGPGLYRLVNGQVRRETQRQKKTAEPTRS